LRVWAIHNSLNPVTRGLGARRYDGDFLAYEPVYKRGFPGIRPPDHCNKPGFEFLCHKMCLSNSPKHMIVAIHARHEP
jgi:hypothetical protein